MKARIGKQIDQLNQKLRLLLEDLKGYSDTQLNRPPAPDKWSPAQVMQHLMLSEQYSLAYIKKKLSFNPQLKKAGMLAGLRVLAINTYLNTPFSFKAPPAIDTPHLSTDAAFWELAKRWKDQRTEMKEYLLSLPDDTLRREIYKHPLIGRMSAMGMLRFFNTHFDRHEKQIKKALRHVPKQHN